ncbi:MAG: hypothetical protein RL026_1328 [Pseudomonadota bacterium]
MRQLTTRLLPLIFALPAVAATEVWRWVDAQGGVHYSDQRVPGAERVTLGGMAPAGPAAPAPATPQAAGDALRSEALRTPVRYSRCSIALPEAEQLFLAPEPVVMSLDVRPRLQAGHVVRATLNGEPIKGWSASSLGHTLAGLPRGSYTLAVQILSADGAVACTLPPVTFHVRQPSLLSPGRQQAPRS